jgi:L-phenylalanine/L-methionine N-acetyltransferase
MPITIRNAELTDVEAVKRIYSGPRVVWGTLRLPYISTDYIRKRLEPNEGIYRLLACADDEAIGEIGLHTFPNHPRRRHVGQIGMAVRDDWQGKGVGTALMQAAIDLADKWLNLSRLELEVYTDNEPAVRLYQKFGFTVEGTAINFAFRDGQFVDTYFMARLRDQKG